MSAADGWAATDGAGQVDGDAGRPPRRRAAAPPGGHGPGTSPSVSGKRRPALLGELAWAALLIVGYDRVAAFTGGRAAPAVAHGGDLLALERFLHLAVERRLDHALAAHQGLGQVLSVYYDFAHGFVTFGVLAILYVRRPDRYRSARWLLVALNVAALVLFSSFPVAPPRLLPGGGFIDVVADSGTWGAWEASGSKLAEHANLYAAFPSLHAAQATWVLLVVLAATQRRSLRGLAVAHLGLTVLVVLSTGNHYVLDVAGGCGLTVLLWFAGQTWARGARGPRSSLAGRAGQPDGTRAAVPQ